MKKLDLIIICIFLAAAGVLYFSGIFDYGRAGEYAVVYANGSEVKRLSLDEDTAFFVENNGHINKIEIKDQTAYMSEADCKDGLCVKQKGIKYGGETIVCLPNRVVIEISGESDIDGVVR